MDLRGMTDDFADAVDIDDRLYGVFTASPGRIVAFDGTLATVQITIRMKTCVDGVVSYIDPPPVTNVPVVLPSSTGAGVFITVPVMVGDPCLLVFGQRGISPVVDHGGMQNPPDTENKLLSRIRHHDMADAICIPGLTCKPNAPASWAMDGVEIRNQTKSVFVKVTPYNIQSSGMWMHTGDFTVFKGNIHVGKQQGVGGNITTDGSVS